MYHRLWQEGSGSQVFCIHMIKPLSYPSSLWKQTAMNWR
jgi:hypothetical protein